MKDSRNISGMVGIFFFLLMMIVFFSTSERNDDGKSNKTIRSSLSVTRSFNIFSLKSSFCTKNDKTSIICKDVGSSDMTVVQQLINNIFAMMDDKSGLLLTFSHIQDPAEVIVPGWLKKINVSIHSLKIQETSLHEIKAKSFADVPFLNLQELSLESNEIIKLNKESFSGLKNLTSLIIRGPNCHIISAEEESLNKVPLLSILEITDCSISPPVLKNLTGGNATFKLDSLKLLDIENNYLGKLLADSFSKLSNLESLYLGSTNLSDGLDSSAFRGTSLKQILMRSTQLTKLPKGIFEPINNTLNQLDLSDNRWNCTCDFQWFQDMYDSTNFIFQGNPLLCYHDGIKQSLSTFQFCGSTTQPHTSTACTTVLPSGSSTGENPCSTSQSTTDTSSSTYRPFTTSMTTKPDNDPTGNTPPESSTGQNPYSTPQPTVHSTSDEISTTNQSITTSWKPPTINPDDYDPVQCFPANRSSPVFAVDKKSLPRIIYLGKENLRFSFTQMGNEPNYIVNIDKTLDNSLVLIFINHAGWILCLSELEDNFIVENLDYGQTYIVCMLRSSQYTVSPRNCQSLNVPQEWGKQSWINNDLKVPILVAISSALICILLTSLCGMYTYIKRNPCVVYGKENVIVVSRENSKKVTVQDQNYEQPRYPPSLVSWSDGYITPKLYESVEEFPIPCIDQIRSGHLVRPRIFPAIRIGHLENEDFESIYSPAGEIYETVNTYHSPYYMNDDSSHNAYSSL